MHFTTRHALQAMRPALTALLLSSAASLAGAQTTWYVDDNHPGDPTPGVSGLGFPFSNPNENGSTSAPFDDIQKGIDAASAGDTVLVLPSDQFGAYSLTTTFGSLDLGGKAITVRSLSGPAVTAIDGSLLVGEVGVRIDSGEGPDTVFEGFTIRNCDSGSVSGASGGGMIVSSASPTVRDCVFESNHAYVGGGLYVSASNAVIADCTFVSNTVAHQGGGVYTNDGRPTFLRCRFDSNVARYGGGFLSRTDSSTHVFVEDCVFVGNSATQPDSYCGGLAKFDTGAITILRSIFVGNTTTDEGGAIRLTGGGLVQDCLLNANVSTNGQGGGISIEGSGTGTVLGCTITGNLGGGVREGPGVVVGRVYNSIVWDNGSFDVGVQMTVNHSNVMGGYGGGGNLDVEPYFRDPFGPDRVRGTLDDDLRLLERSRCIDAGNTSYLGVGYPVDLAGKPRVVDHPKADIGIPLVGFTVDIGAHEFQLRTGSRVRGIQTYP